MPTKLSVNDVVAIRKAYASSRSETYTVLADRYGVSAQTVRQAVRGETFKKAGGPLTVRDQRKGKRRGNSVGMGELVNYKDHRQWQAKHALATMLAGIQGRQFVVVSRRGQLDVIPAEDFSDDSTWRLECTVRPDAKADGGVAGLVH